MDISQLKSLQGIFPLVIEKYERFIPNVEGMGVPEKINAIIQYLNQIGKISNDVVRDWNKVMKWILDEGLNESVVANIESLIAAGRFDDLIQEALVEVDGRLDGVESSLTSNSSKIAVIGQKKIYARDYGVKLDGITDDTAALNNFFSHFGEGELILDNGVALVTGQLNIGGVWRPDTGNSSVKRLTFSRASIKYMGPSNKAAIQFYNHFSSSFDGIAITRDSNPTYINFAGMWYSKFMNFEVPKITFGYNNSDITATLLTKASFTNVFDKGYIFGGGMEFYGNGITNSAVINSMRVNDVLFDGRNTSSYNLKFYGTGAGFENFVFNGCDLSYATVSNLYIDATQSTMGLSFDGCYFDSDIPVITDLDYKDARVSINNSREATNGHYQHALVRTKNFLNTTRLSVIGNEADNIPRGVLNLSKNGDMLFPAVSGTWLTTAGTPLPTLSMGTNANTINGNSLTVTYNTVGQNVIFFGLPAPATGVYTVAYRIKKTGQGKIQISFNGIYVTYDLSKYADGEELLLTSNARGKIVTQGTSLNSSIPCLTLTSASIVVEVLEVITIQGTHAAFNLPIHPKANIYPTSGTTANRPTPYRVGLSYFDTTLGKQIHCKQISPVIWVDGTGTTV